MFADKVNISDNDGFAVVAVILGRPKSSGRIKLNPETIDSPPEIEMGCLSEPRDLDVLVEGIKFALKMYEETSVLAKLGGYYPRVPLKVCEHLHFRSDDYWKCYINQFYVAGVHISGTCRMGSGPDDKDAVVDSNLKVLGIDGLRVVDASIMPNVTNSNTQAPIYAIAEKASDAILKDWEGIIASKI